MDTTRSDVSGSPEEPVSKSWVASLGSSRIMLAMSVGNALRRAGWPTLGFCLLVGCGGSKDKDETEPASPGLEKLAPLAASPAVLSEPPVVTVVEAGAEPRLPLRYELAAGHEETASVLAEVNTELEMDGRPVNPIRLPGLELALTIRVSELLADGDARYRQAIQSARIVERPGVMPRVMEVARSVAKGAQGIELAATIDSRGRRRDGQTSAPADAGDMARQLVGGALQSMEQLAVVFPAEPVGQGASWTVRYPSNHGGYRIANNLRFQLVSRRGNTVELAAEISQSAEPQTFEIRKGLTGKLSSHQGSGSGTIALDLRRLAPSYRIELRNDSTMLLGDQMIRSETAIGIRVTPQ